MGFWGTSQGPQWNHTRSPINLHLPCPEHITTQAFASLAVSLSLCLLLLAFQIHQGRDKGVWLKQQGAGHNIFRIDVNVPEPPETLISCFHVDPCYLIDKIDTAVEYRLVPDSLVAQSRSYQASPMGGFVIYHRKTPLPTWEQNHAISLSLTVYWI